MSIKQGHLSPFKLLPAPPGTCPECGAKHDPGQPHNRESLLYQYTFFDKHGRWPAWSDAMAHCDEYMREKWTAALAETGIIVPETAGGHV